MQGPKSLVWLASYPKSGNTWLRAFLANYFIRSDAPLPFEQIQRVSHGDSGAPPLQQMAGGRDPRLMTPQQLIPLRTARLAEIARLGEVNFVKTHNAHIRIGSGWLIPAALTKAAIYVIRDPRDMLLSYADHWGVTPEAAVGQIANKNNSIAPNPKTVRQFISSWTENVKSWTRARDIRVLTIRYEDMLTDPHDVFTRVVRHVGAPFDAEALDLAIRHSSFDTLRQIEADQGFSEKGMAQERFFRKGEAGQWQATLDPALARRIEADHGPTMKRFGYV
jgi:hypothetical protein